MTENRVFNIHDFPSFEIEIDFQNPELSQNKLGEITLNVENECPVGKAFLDDIIKENIVFEDENGKIWFEKENGFTEILKPYFIDILLNLRKSNPNGINFLKFKKE